MNVPPDEVIEAARLVATTSPCAKSKRGVVAYHGPALDRAAASGTVHRNHWFMGSGFNSPPEPFWCDRSERCRQNCSKTCVHAEVRAIRSIRDDEDLSIISLVHVKVVDAAVVAGAGPSCWQCSRELLDVGIGGIWLLEAQRWHDEVPCDTCNQKTVIAQDAGTTGVCEPCKAAGRVPGLLDLSRTKTIHDPASGEWRFYTAADFHRATLGACGIGGPQ